MSDQNWRTETEAGDYFLHQKKQTTLADRRPVIRKASDLVGPGIGASAVRITDFNDLLATFNGYYSSEPGASNAPNDTDAFVGQVVSDGVLGGLQMFTSLTTGTEYRRSFNRSPTDPESLGWSGWSGQRIAPSVFPASGDPAYTTVLDDELTVLELLTGDTLGDESVYEQTSGGVLLRKQGVYTGVIQIGCLSDITVDAIFVARPDGSETLSVTNLDVPTRPDFYFPFTVRALDDQQGFSVSVFQSTGSDHQFWWTFSGTRVGDAV